MTDSPLIPSQNDPTLRPDTNPDGSPVTAPGLAAEEATGSPADPGDPTEPRATES